MGLPRKVPRRMREEDVGHLRVAVGKGGTIHMKTESFY